MLDFDRAAVFKPLVGQIFAIDPGAVLRILKPQSGLPEHALAGAANRHDWQTHPLRLGEGARVDWVSDVLRQDAGSGAGDVFHFFQFDSELAGNAHGGGIELGTSAPGHTSGIKRVLHFSFASAFSMIRAILSAPGRL